MGPEIAVALISIVVSIAGIAKGLRAWFERNDTKVCIEVDGMKIAIGEVRPEAVEELVKVLTKGRGQATTKSPEAGFVLAEVLLFLVPGIIALLFAGAFVYLSIANQTVPNYTTPKELTAAMTTIIGYYFGVGASTAASKSNTVTASELEQKLAAALKSPQGAM
jgi:hypothetical protein